MKKKKVVAIIQARLGSTRLPRKVLYLVLDRPLLWYQIERLRICKRISRIIVATTENPEDEEIGYFCENSNVNCFRGNENDVLDRYYKCAKFFKADPVLRITADCPIIDPVITDKVIEFYIKNPGYDLVKTGLSYPEGFDAEVLPFKKLAIAWREAKLKSEREHVTAFLWKNHLRFKIKTLALEKDYSFLRLAVDEAIDFEVVKGVLEELYPKKGIDFDFGDILALYRKKPDIFKKNVHVIRNEGYLKSLQEESRIMKS